MSAQRSRKGFPVRKVLEDTLQEDSDDDDSDEDKFLNLNEEDGQNVEPCEDVPFLTISAVFQRTSGTKTPRILNCSQKR